MWIRKADRDRRKGVDSPMPTQVVSTEEFIPRPQSEQQKKVEQLIVDMADKNSKKLGLSRRDYMGSSMGLAACFLASNAVWGKNFEVDAEEAMDEAAYKTHTA